MKRLLYYFAVPRACRQQLIAALSCTALLAACGSPDPGGIAIDGATMGTSYSVRLGEAASTIDAAGLKRQIDQALAEISASMSTYDPDSELSRLNATTIDDWQPISPELYFVLRRAREISAASSGAFDTTAAPLVNLWGFGPDARPAGTPAAERIESARRHVDWALLLLRESPRAARKTDPQVQVDLSAIAKGYAVDRVAELLESRGIGNYLAEIGGEVRARGRRIDGRRWRIGLEAPVAGERHARTVITLENAAVATSGDYRNFFELDHIRYSHTINPRTGYPVTHTTASVSVVAETAMDADAWATALLVLGQGQGLDVAVENNIAALFTVRDGEVFRSMASPALRTMYPDTCFAIRCP